MYVSLFETSPCTFIASKLAPTSSSLFSPRMSFKSYGENLSFFAFRQNQRPTTNDIHLDDDERRDGSTRTRRRVKQTATFSSPSRKSLLSWVGLPRIQRGLVSSPTRLATSTKNCHACTPKPLERHTPGECWLHYTITNRQTE